MGSYPSLLSDLGLKRSDTGNAWLFQEALSQAKKGTAVGDVYGTTLLMDYLLPYDCSFEEGEENKLDVLLKEFSHKEDVLVFLLDSISDTHAFSLFANGRRKRRWAADRSNILCNEGDSLNAEIPFIVGNASELPMFTSEHERRIIAVMDSFLQESFEDLLKDNNTMFHFFA